MRGKAFTIVMTIGLALALVLGMFSFVSPSTILEGINEENKEIENLVSFTDFLTNLENDNEVFRPSTEPIPRVNNYQLMKKLLALDGAAGDWLGHSVSISGDTIVIGAFGDDFGANLNQGSAYVFERNQGGADVWGQVTKLTASDGEADDRFGVSVSISGDTIVVGAPSDDPGTGFFQGSAYVFERNQGGADNWGQVTKLIALDGETGDFLGYSVSIFGDTIVVGAPSDDPGTGFFQGSAYVFERNQGGADSWGQVTKLTASDGAADDFFASSVSIFDDTIVVGAYYDDVGTNIDQGSAYMFERNQGGADNWGQVTKLTASDGAEGVNFATSVSISGDTVVAGAAFDNVGANFWQGSAYVFERNQGGADNWGQVTKLIALDGETGDFLGYSVSIFGDTIVVGAPSDDPGTGFFQGSAYVFERNKGGADVWGQLTKLTASDGANSDDFGISVFTSDDTIVVGAVGDDVSANSNQGSAYNFVSSNETWMEIAHPISADGAAWDSFGNAVSISGDTAVVGVWKADIGANSDQGSAYVFKRNTGSADNWGEVTKLTASDGAAGDYFGYSVCVFGDTIIVGAYFDDVGANLDQGSAYVFERNQGGTDNWGQVTKLIAMDGAAWDCFGYSVSISGDTIVVGANHDDVGANNWQGSAYVFERNQGGADNWGEVTKITALDGAEWDCFGVSVSISSDTVAVGACSDDVGANMNQGSAYVFERNQGGADNWGEVTKITALDGAEWDFFGVCVLFGETIVVGAFADGVGVNSEQGSAYVFERNQGGADNWGQVIKITASDGATNDWFGMSVSISGDAIVVGATYDDIGANSEQGSAYVFERNQGGADNWGEVTKLTASDGAAGDRFGFSVSISGDTVVVGASYDDVGANANQGSAYIYKLTPEFVIPLDEGWNLISLPLLQPDTSIDKVLSSINGKWDYIQVYNSTDPDHWKTNATFKPDQLNDLKSLDHKIGFWINITEPRVYLFVTGNESLSTSILLYAGWNLIGYPSLTQKSISDALAGTGYDKPVEGFNATAPYRISLLADTYLMKPGEGYWIHIPADTTWIIDW